MVCVLLDNGLLHLDPVLRIQNLWSLEQETPEETTRPDVISS